MDMCAAAAAARSAGQARARVSLDGWQASAEPYRSGARIHWLAAMTALRVAASGRRTATRCAIAFARRARSISDAPASTAALSSSSNPASSPPSTSCSTGPLSMLPPASPLRLGAPPRSCNCRRSTGHMTSPPPPASAFSSASASSSGADASVAVGVAKRNVRARRRRASSSSAGSGDRALRDPMDLPASTEPPLASILREETAGLGTNGEEWHRVPPVTCAVCTIACACLLGAHPSRPLSFVTIRVPPPAVGVVLLEDTGGDAVVAA